ncbi:MAG: hypothetical protein WCG25_07560 [bacterium]
MIDPLKIKKIEYLIDANGQIQNTDNIQTNLSSTKLKRQIKVD